ncbi:hypothetical protein BLNAU_17719 [Blattamonas nauphoetae]|uniref:Uncharacterized protein n=1 Tax=Blattamonas nauphoetae TaxID=2049346 RepID=A0ABQ9X6J1_9EUKA|nr:hypothetical protein BLNAU_17719 [Blattamonas nauphoetae]
MLNTTSGPPSGGYPKKVALSQKMISSSFTLCTFTLCTVDGNDGSAIQANVKGSLTVDTCSFRLCSATHAFAYHRAMGGAISHGTWDSSTFGSSYTNCVFQQCSATDVWVTVTGGVFYSYCPVVASFNFTPIFSSIAIDFISVYLQNILKLDEKDETNEPTMESVLERLIDSSAHPRNKVNSFQWTQIPTLLTTHIQSQPKQNNELLSQLLQRIMKIFDECFDSHTPIPNKRLLHSSLSQLSQLSQSPSLTPSIQRDVERCFSSLIILEDGEFVVIQKAHLESLESTQTAFFSLQQISNQQEREKAEWTEKMKTDFLTIQTLQKEKEQIQIEKEELRSELASNSQKLEKNERSLSQAQNTIQQMKTEVARKEEYFSSSDVIVKFSHQYFRVNGYTVTRLKSNFYAGCCTKSVSTGIHRFSIKADGCLWSAHRPIVENTRPQNGQEWSAEADLEKRTLHFFIDGVQQPHYFINIPVPLVFAIDACSREVPIEITFWGEENQSHVTFEGTGHRLG